MNIKKSSIIIVGIILCILLLSSIIAGCSSTTPQETKPSPSAPSTPAAPTPAESEQVYTMNIQLMHPRTQSMVQLVQLPFAQTLEERSNGRLKVNVLDLGSATPPASVVDAVAANTLQGSWIGIGWTPGRFPLVELTQIPMLFPSATVSNQVAQHLLETFPEFQNEWPDGVKLLCAQATALNQVITVKQVKTMEDLKGMRMICPDAGSVRETELMDGEPITIAITSPSDFYIALERGMGDGMWIPLSPAKAMKLAEVAKYITISDQSSSAWFFGINRGFYDSLPDDLRKILDEETGKKLSEATGRVGFDESAVADGKSMMDTYGVKFYKLPEEERNRWKAQLNPLREEIMQGVISKGYSAQLVQSIVDEMESYAAELIQKGAYIPDYSELLK